MDLLEQAQDRYITQMMEMQLEYMAKNYALNVMILRRLSLVFGRLQSLGALSENEVKEISEAVQALYIETEASALDELHRKLKKAGQDIVDSIARDVAGEEAQ